MGTPELPPPSLAPPRPGPPGVGGGSIHGLVQAAVPDCSLQTPPWDAKSVGPVDSAPKPVRPVVWEEGAPGRSFRRYRRQALQSPGRQHSGSSGTLQTDGRSDTWPGHGARWGTVSAAGATVAAVDLPPAGDRPGVKFLVMSDRGPVAETEWSSETRLQQAKALQAVPGPQSAGTVVIIAILSVLLAVLFTALLALLIYTCHDTCRSAPISGPEQSTCVRRYNTHHVTDPPAVGAS
ncbi:uroplakin-3b-like protein 2 isoform X4 [Felis catus]|uniref:uroplakin-3b-like protein 2 isoform X4 n=1 Tax=Felis catus TaxID=9685 RepID=UPI001D1A2FED|nr:uroplakin-3b-like protein 2 isoform X4 [Felis catus]